jgi:predicted naringenin-chalcone synthase
MRKYESAAVPLALTAARRALDDGRLRRRDVTHLITVSCTGMFLPGLDYALTRELGLNPDVIRVPLQFLGCAAGMTAIRMAAQMVKADERACVLVVCVELCTLHIQPSGERESLYASAFFGDGASACVIGNPGNDHQAYFKLGEGKAILIPDTAEEMRWTIGDYGFDLFLSPQIPGHIGRIIHSALESYWDSGMPPQFWAIHPGGRGIVDAVQDALELTEAETAASRSVLRQFGNMSSATILFVLDEIRRQLAGNGLDQHPAEGVAIAFGPGMHAEIMRMTAYPAVRHAARMEQEVKHV